MTNKNVSRETTPYLKPGDTMIVDGQKLLVKEGHCNACFFSRTDSTRGRGAAYCASKFKEGCGSNLGNKLIVVAVDDGI